MIDPALSQEIRRTLDADPVWGVYALADLQPALAGDCTWQLQRTADGRAGLALLYAGLQPTILFTAGAPELVAECLATWAAAALLPPRAYLSMREEHEAVIQPWYDNRADRRPMLRMALTRPSEIAGATAGGPPRLIRLRPNDAPRIAALYAHGGPFTPDAFGAQQLDAGIFFGIEADPGADADQPALIAAGGTHVVDWQAGFAAIGNMYTHPTQRGQGYAGAILAAIVDTLRAGGVHTIVLNVDQRNVGARRLYEKHGFSVHCPYLEGIAQRCV